MKLGEFKAVMMAGAGIKARAVHDKGEFVDIPEDAHFSRFVNDTAGEEFLKYFLRPLLPKFSPHCQRYQIEI